MKHLTIPTLFLLAMIASANTSAAQTAPADKQTAKQSKQDAKATKQKPSATKATPQAKETTHPKSSGSKKSTTAADAAYAAAYKEGLPEQNKGTTPK